MMRAKPILATAAIALSLTACGWMGGDQKAQRPTGTAGISAGDAPQTATSQQYPQGVAPQLVQRVQRSLGERGYDPGKVDGVWGESTQTALRNFQRDQNIQATGQLNTQTLAALGIQPGSQTSQQQPQQQQQRQGSQMQQMQQQQQPYQPTTRRGASMQQQGGTQQQSMNPEVVRDVQQELRDRGYQVGQIDGMWGRNTRQAVMSFQRDQNIQATGSINEETLAALGIEGGDQLGQAPEATDQEVGAMPEVEVEDEPALGTVEPEPDTGLMEEPEPDIGPAERPQPR